MNITKHIIDVSEADFEYEVLAYSQQVPVVVDFWAEWCSPCRILGPILEKLAREANGAFRLAKLNVDDNPKLAQRYNVRSIPAVKAFREGVVVAEFLGAQPEIRVREFLRQIAPGKSDLALGKAYSLLQKKDWTGAEKIFRQILEEEPGHPAAMLGLIKSLLFQNRLAEAQEKMQHFPASKELAAVERLRPLLEALQWYQESAGYSDDPLEAAYLNALRLITRGNLPAAMDGILDVLRQDKHFRNDEARKVMLALFEMLGDDNLLVQQYRNELSMVLF